MTKKAAIYARKSVAQEESVSIDNQIADCKERLEKNEPYEVYQDDGFSGKNNRRPDLQRLLADVKAGMISKVIVYKLDRISRNTPDFYEIYKVLEEHDCIFCSAHDIFDGSTAQGRFQMELLQSLATMERANIVQRVKDSYYYRAKTDHRFLGGRAPLGYDITKNEDKLSTLVANEKMNIVTDFFFKYAYDSSTSLHNLAAYAKEKYGYGTSSSRIRIILKNPLYVKSDKKIYNYYRSMGVTMYSELEEFDGIHGLQIIGKTRQNKSTNKSTAPDQWKAYVALWEGSVDSRTFLLVQERLSQNQRYTKSNKPLNRMGELSGLIKCAKCGRAIKMKSANANFSCISRTEMGGLCDASFKGLRLTYLKEEVGKEVQQYLNHFAENQLRHKKKKDRIKNEIKILEDEKRNLLNSIATTTLTGLPEDVVKSATKNILFEVAKRDRELEKLHMRLEMDIAPSDKIETRVLHIFQEFVITLDELDFSKISYNDLSTEEKQALLRTIIRRILVFEDLTIQIVWMDDEDIKTSSLYNQTTI